MQISQSESSLQKLLQYCALLLDGAETLHSFAGIGTCRKKKEQLLEVIASRRSKSDEWKNVEVLVIDEGSLISAQVLETCEFIARNIRGNDFPFGGIQVIISADFYQLPPVKNGYDPGFYLFQLEAFKSVFPHIVELEEVVRQNELDFIEFLSRLAKGTCDQFDVEYVQTNFTTTPAPNDFELNFVPKLVCTNFEILCETAFNLERLPGEVHLFASEDSGKKKLLQKCIADEKLLLKENMPVMLLYNLSKSHVNGLQGIVKNLAKNSGIVVQFPSLNDSVKIEKKSWAFFSDRDSDKVVAQRCQYPLKPSWFITTHKAQGQTMAAAIVVSGNEFVSGQLYVACSRVSSKKGLCIRGFNLDKLIKPSEKVTDFYCSIKDIGHKTLGDVSCCCKKFVMFPDIYQSYEDSLNQDIDGFYSEFTNEVEVSEHSSDEADEADSISDESHDIRPDDVTISFEETLASLNDQQESAFEIPTEFSLTQFIEMLQVESKMGMDINESSPANKPSQQDIFRLLLRAPDSLNFIHIQWKRISLYLKPRVNDEGHYEQKEMTEFCSSLYALACSEDLLSEFAHVLHTDTDNMGSQHFTVCSDIVFGIATVLLQSLCARITGNIDQPFKSLGNMSPEEMAKIRYVGGWTIKKIKDRSKKYINTNIESVNRNVRQQLKEEIITFKIAETLLANASVASSSKYPESFQVIESRAYRTGGLTNVSDATFLHFAKLEEKRINLLNHQRLHMLRGEMVSNALERMNTDDDLITSWQGLFQNILATVLPEKQDSHEDGLIVKKCASVLFSRINEKYLRMGAGQYLRDFRRDTKWKKTEAHRKKVLMRQEIKATKTDKVSIDSVRQDDSVDKSRSHSLLKAMIEKHPRIFHDTRLYSNKDLQLLLSAYGRKMNAKKEVLANALVDAIKSRAGMQNVTVFD